MWILIRKVLFLRRCFFKGTFWWCVVAAQPHPPLTYSSFPTKAPFPLAGATVRIPIAGAGVHGAALLPKGGPGASVYRLATQSQGSHPGSTKPAAGREIHREFCPTEPKAPPSPMFDNKLLLISAGEGRKHQKDHLERFLWFAAVGC